MARRYERDEREEENREILTGLGELTTVGMAQQHRLGKWLKGRYGKFLGEKWDRKAVSELTIDL